MNYTTHDIPRVLHMFWDGPPLPKEYRSFPARWREMNPGWELEWWDDTRYRAEVMKHTTTGQYYENPRQWSPKSNVWQWRSDIARYNILKQFGGVWVDADLEPLKTIEPLLGQAPAFVARESPQWINNAFIGCAPGHPFIREVVDGLPGRVRGNRHLRVNRSIGARYITEVVGRHPGVMVLPRELVYPFSFTELHRRGEEFPQAYTKHHWNNRTQARSPRRGRR